MELRLEAPGARVPRVDPEHAVEDRQALLQVAILDPKGGEDKEGIDVVRIRQEALPDQRCRVRTLNGHADTSSPGGRLHDAARPGSRPPAGAFEVAPSSPPPVHPSEAARQERLEDRRGLIEARDPTVPVDQRGTVGFLQRALDKAHGPALVDWDGRVASLDQTTPILESFLSGGFRRMHGRWR